MKIKKILFLFLILMMSSMLLSGCLAKSLEQEINVVFMFDDEFIASGTITQFKNIKSPTVDDTYIPVGYKFFGWSAVKGIHPTDENFKEEYVGAGKMIHWSDVYKYVENSTVILKAAYFDKEEIPQEYHYCVIAWYDKVATSGLDSTLMEKYEKALKAYLSSEGVSDADLASIVIRGYTGNVGTSCGAIMDDGDVDIMFGWSSISNVTQTGGMSEDMLLEQIADYAVGTHARCIYRLDTSDSIQKVFDWFKTDECKAIFA